MKIGILLRNLDSGGAENRILELLQHLNKYEAKDFYFYVYIYDSKNGNLYEQYKELENAKIVNIRSQRISILIKNIAALDVFISNLYLFSGIIMFLTKCLGVKKRISYIRTYIEPKRFLDKLKYIFLKKMMTIYSTDIICVSNSILNNLDLSKNRKAQVIYNGINFINIHEEMSLSFKKQNLTPPKRLLHIGRYNEAKNHDFLIKYFEHYLKLVKDAHLTLIGKDVERNMYDIIKHKNLENNITFIDYTNNIAPHLLDSDLFLFPSIREGLPGVLIESASVNIPVIASDIDPNIEISKYFDNISICELDVEEWCNITLNLKDTKKKFQVANEFTLDEHIKKFIELMEI